MNEQNQINQQNTSHDHNDHTTSSLIHLSSLASLIKFAIPIPFLSILFPLVLWQSLKKESEFINHHGKEAVNFNMSFLLYNFLLGVGAFIMVGATVFNAIRLENIDGPMEIINLLLTTGGFVSILVVFGVLSLLKIVFIILATIKAGQGEWYRYPMTIRFIK